VASYPARDGGGRYSHAIAAQRGVSWSFAHPASTENPTNTEPLGQGDICGASVYVPVAAKLNGELAPSTSAGEIGAHCSTTELYSDVEARFAVMPTSTSPLGQSCSPTGVSGHVPQLVLLIAEVTTSSAVVVIAPDVVRRSVPHRTWIWRTTDSGLLGFGGFATSNAMPTGSSPATHAMSGLALPPLPPRTAVGDGVPLPAIVHGVKLGDAASEPTIGESGDTGVVSLAVAGVNPHAQTPTQARRHTGSSYSALSSPR
jgi:hypothetical protein